MRVFQLLFVVMVFACQSSIEVPKIDQVYQANFEQYLIDRQEERDYYLRLCGLTKLPALTSTFGKDSLSDIPVPVEGVPAVVGYFVNQSDEITFIASGDQLVKNEAGAWVDTVNYSLNESGNSEKLFVGELSWMIITRGGEPYVRSWDGQNPAVKAFQKFDRFKLSTDFMFQADFSYYKVPRERIVSTQLGPPETVKMVGEVSFEYQGETYILEVGNNGFTMVGDATTGVETYGGGRYIDFILPESSGPLLVDFNKLYNPPCTFSEFTTCQYPSEQNMLPFKITAGELYSGH
ncbi:MAG: DUF1684 domain-containing protein [Cyclobacteriaceae bacterium]